MKNDFFTEKQLKDFLVLKKAAKSDFIQYLILMLLIVSAFISNLFYQSLTSALLMGAIFILSSVLVCSSTSKKLIELFDNLISSNAEALKKRANLKD